ncbi:MAG: hypothetical protein NNA23_10250 [Nitrospira sp.]|nr:hypothetical protein [Nitrospira sp.]
MEFFSKPGGAQTVGTTIEGPVPFAHWLFAAVLYNGSEHQYNPAVLSGTSRHRDDRGA